VRKPGAIATPPRGDMVLVTGGVPNGVGSVLLGGGASAPRFRRRFWIDRTPVTNREFRQFVGAKHVRQRAREILRLRPSFGEGRIPGRTPLPARS